MYLRGLLAVPVPFSRFLEADFFYPSWKLEQPCWIPIAKTFGPQFPDPQIRSSADHNRAVATQLSSEICGGLLGVNRRLS